MRNNTIDNIFEKIESDSSLQNLIAQANARYILYNTRENSNNYPNYTIEDSQLNLLAFQYLNIGCNFFERKDFHKAAFSLEKGASILESIHGSVHVQTELQTLYTIIASLAYYVGFQYSKSFILISKVRGNTVIASYILKFLNRQFDSLESSVLEVFTDVSFNDNNIADSANESAALKVYEKTIAKALFYYIQFYRTGDNEFINRAKSDLLIIKEIAEIRNEPDFWWIIRLLLLIIDGFSESSLWHVLDKYFDTKEDNSRKYIHALVYKKNSVTELFTTQRDSLPLVMDDSRKGSVISLPTSSGKTRIGELAILNCLENNPLAKVLYIAPFRSLAYEIESSLNEIFNNIGFAVSQLYGGSLFSKLDQIIVDESSIIVATPEKSKALLRSNTDILSLIELVVIDEGHLLGADERLITNEMFYEELRYHMESQGGKFLLLSAVLPNPEDLSQWLTHDPSNVYRNDWRPSDERMGILEWTGSSVNLKWESADKQRESFNNSFVVKNKLPLQPRQRVHRHFPTNKNQAVAATAYKLKDLGPVLIFVGLTQSVFTIAREYEKCIAEDEVQFEFTDTHNWKAFKLICTEIYGEESEWLRYAKMGVFCHSGELHNDLRLPLERLMRNEKPRVIIATSTLGQGVNIGVSTVIFSTFFQAGKPISNRDFWNIAGRAGRAYVDHEGKVLAALDLTQDRYKIRRDRRLIKSYFDKNQINKVESGLLVLIKTLKRFSSLNEISFESLLNLIAENDLHITDPEGKSIDDYFDWLDDSLLSLHNSYNKESNNLDWIETYFSHSLAYIQANHSEDVSNDEVLGFVRSRTKGVVKKIGDNKQIWEKAISTGLPINSFLQIEENLDEIIQIIHVYFNSNQGIEDYIILFNKIEEILSTVNVIRNENLPDGLDLQALSFKWLKAKPVPEITSNKNVIPYYTYTLPWVLYGLSNRLRKDNLEEEANTLEELAILVEVGLPNLTAVKIYQAGIRSRSAAYEIASTFYADNINLKSILDYKLDIIMYSENIKRVVSERTASWIDLLNALNKGVKLNIKSISNLRIRSLKKHQYILIPKQINKRQYLISRDLEGVFKIVENTNIDFSKVNELHGVYFEYDNEIEAWTMKSDNPHIKIYKPKNYV